MWRGHREQFGGQESALYVQSEVMFHMMQAAKLIEPWSSSGFEFVSTLKHARSNHGTVDFVQNLGNNSFVVAKKMPNWWMATDSQGFQRQMPYCMENPWRDIATVRYLESQHFPYLCKSHGVFRDTDFTYVVSEFAEQGSLFEWFKVGPLPGLEREATLRAIICEVLSAVRMLHNLGVAHRDLSLENILSTIKVGYSPQIRIIDFGMATWSRPCLNEPCGKPSYQAPEIHVTGTTYDPFLMDSFALGVVLFTLCAQDYPWRSTKNGGCKMFRYVLRHGFQRYLAARKVLKGNGERLNRVFSKKLAQLIEALVCPYPERRLQLAEACIDFQQTCL